MESLTFRSRIDAWLALLCFGPVGVALVSIVAKYRVAPAAGLVVAGIMCALAMAFLVWLFTGTSYSVTATDLVIRSGPVRATVPLSAIRKVQRSSTLLAGPALSLRRLEIQHGKYDTAIVSPQDMDGFIAALQARNPEIEVAARA